MNHALPAWDRPPRYMSQAEVRAFFRVITNDRDQLLFSLIYLYGLRVSETNLLRLGDLDLAHRRVLIRRVKGGAWSERPLFDNVLDPLRRYIGALELQTAESPLFPGREGPLKKRRIQALFTIYRDRAGLAGGYTCHSLRHSIATHLLDAGLPLEFVQDHLGHRSIQSTTIYARITSQHRVQVFKRLERSPWIVRPLEDGNGQGVGS